MKLLIYLGILKNRKNTILVPEIQFFEKKHVFFFFDLKIRKNRFFRVFEGYIEVLKKQLTYTQVLFFGGSL